MPPIPATTLRPADTPARSPSTPNAHLSLAELRVAKRELYVKWPRRQQLTNKHPPAHIPNTTAASPSTTRPDHSLWQTLNGDYSSISRRRSGPHRLTQLWTTDEYGQDRESADEARTAPKDTLAPHDHRLTPPSGPTLQTTRHRSPNRERQTGGSWRRQTYQRPTLAPTSPHSVSQPGNHAVRPATPRSSSNYIKLLLTLQSGQTEETAAHPSTAHLTAGLRYDHRRRPPFRLRQPHVTVTRAPSTPAASGLDKDLLQTYGSTRTTAPPSARSTSHSNVRS